MLHIILMCISHFTIFANDLLLLFNLYLFYIIEMLDKKQIWVIFLFQFSMGHKAAETTQNINNTWGPGTANKCTV